MSMPRVIRSLRILWAVLAGIGALDSRMSSAELASSADAPTNRGQVVNFSTLGTLSTGSDTFIKGFGVAGGTNKRLLLRAVGNGLSPLLGRGSYLADPVLEVWSQEGVTKAKNDDWNSNDVELRRAMQQVGAVPLTSGSADAALVGDFPPGNYTMVVRSSSSGGTGTVLAEVFDLEPGNGQLLNFSTRAHVGVGADILVSGFVIAGDRPITALVRAVGPKLSSFGIRDVLQDPQLEVRTSGGDVVASNDNWAPTQSLLTAAMEKIGAFRLDQGSKDAALLVTLPPGAYTATARGVVATTGTALIELYELEQPPLVTAAALVIYSFSVGVQHVGEWYNHQPQLRVLEPTGKGAVTVTSIAFNLDDDPNGRSPTWYVTKPVFAGSIRELIDPNVYGDYEFEVSGYAPAARVSVLITYRDNEGGVHSISAVTPVTAVP